MGLEIIRNDAKEVLRGDEKVLNRIRNLYKDIEYEAYLYINATIGKLTPKFLLIDAHKGIAIIEVKEWECSDIDYMNDKKVIIRNKEEENPVRKVRKYADIAKGIMICNEPRIEEAEEYLYASTVMVNMTSKEVAKSPFNKALHQPYTKCFYNEEISKLTLNDLFSEDEIHLSHQEMAQLRIMFFPESKISKPIKSIHMTTIKGTVAVLDKEQENFAKKIPYGHYMVTGIPGSGKTVILIARAIHLIKEHPEWRVVILAYNNALVNKIEEKIKDIANKFSENQFMEDIAIHQIEVKTFHKMAMEFVKDSEGIKKDEEFWNNILPNYALKNAQPIYDAVLIDEYQDFRDNWIKLCIAVCKKYHYRIGKKEVEGINLFMAGDRLQSIYNTKIHNWSEFGIDMRGRSKLLKTTYRAGKTSIDLALKFLEQSPGLEDEVKRFYKEDNENEVEIYNIEGKDKILFKEGDGDRVVGNLLEQLIYKEHYAWGDILIICPTWKLAEAIMREVPLDIRNHIAVVKGKTKEVSTGKTLMSTYQSSKGLEAKVAILVEVDHFKGKENRQEDMLERKLVYVGMTRASEEVVIHANDFSVESLAKEIKCLANQ